MCTAHESRAKMDEGIYLCVFLCCVLVCVPMRARQNHILLQNCASEYAPTVTYVRVTDAHTYIEPGHIMCNVHRNVGCRPWGRPSERGPQKILQLMWKSFSFAYKALPTEPASMGYRTGFE